MGKFFFLHWKAPFIGSSHYFILKCCLVNTVDLPALQTSRKNLMFECKTFVVANLINSWLGQIVTYHLDWGCAYLFMWLPSPAYLCAILSRWLLTPPPHLTSPPPSSANLFRSVENSQSHHYRLKFACSLFFFLLLPSVFVQLCFRFSLRNISSSVTKDNCCLLDMCAYYFVINVIQNEAVIQKFRFLTCPWNCSK